MNNEIIFNRFKILNLIGKGSFGEVYKGLDLKNNSKHVAIKIQHDNNSGILQHEAEIYTNLSNNIDKNKKNHIISDFLYSGYFNNKFYLIIKLLGKSLEDVFNDNNRKFSLQTIINIGLRLTYLLQVLHNNSYIHRDLKPENFLIGNNKQEYIYMIDFGLAKQYIKNNCHIKQIKGKSLTGTTRYSSINSHIGNDLSRRDDLESMFYILIYFYKGSLPWQGIKSKNLEDKIYKIGLKKQMISNEELCSGLPINFLYLIKYIKNLEFNESPNYRYIKEQFIQAANELKIKISVNNFDWI